MSLWTDFQIARKHSRVAAITKQIAALGQARHANKKKALALTHERERMLGQELTSTPRALQRK